MQLRTLAPVALALAALTSLLGACNAGTGENEAATLETDACHDCRIALSDCSSKATTDEDFLGCRDAWQSCQSGRGVRPGDCSNPSDEEACSLCRETRTECVAGKGGDCDAEFGVCKSLLMTRGDLVQQCGADETLPPEVLCNICQEDFASCVSDASGANRPVCGDKFELCRESNGLARNVCATPRGDAACTMCQEHHAECAASGGTSCDGDFEACAKTIAPGCSLDQGNGGAGGGGEGGGDAGGSTGEGGSGAGGSGDTCAHDACVEGTALDAACSTCAGDVCAADSYCCDTAWDNYCTDAAIQLCGC